MNYIRTYIQSLFPVVISKWLFTSPTLAAFMYLFFSAVMTAGRFIFCVHMFVCLCALVYISLMFL